MAAPAIQRRIALAAVAGAHGVKGEVRLKLFAEGIDSLSCHSKLFVGGEERAVRDLRAGGKTAIARFDGVCDRTAAEALRGTLIEVERSALPPLGEGEYYHADLVDLPCFDGEGESIGRVAGIENFGAGDILEIVLADGKRAMVPFRDPLAVLGDNRITIDREYLI